MTEITAVEHFIEQLAPVDSLVPRQDPTRKRPLAKPVYKRQAVTIVGVKQVINRFLPVSHDGEGIETYVDKVYLLGKQRAEFISRKMKGIERRAHMSLFRELVEAGEQQTDWETYFNAHFGKACSIPNNLCVACWNCSLFGGMEAGSVGTFARIRYFDAYSIQDRSECIATQDGEEGMGIGNQLYEDLMKARDSASYHLYEYVKAGTLFPFITIIENPTLLDVSGFLSVIRRADAHGYGRYSANHGKFATKVLAVATGYPRFSVLDMLAWAETQPLEQFFEQQAKANKQKESEKQSEDNKQEEPKKQEASEKQAEAKQPPPLFDSLLGSVMLTSTDLDDLETHLQPAFKEYLAALGKEKPRKEK